MNHVPEVLKIQRKNASALRMKFGCSESVIKSCWNQEILIITAIFLWTVQIFTVQIVPKKARRAATARLWCMEELTGKDEQELKKEFRFA